MQPPNDRPARIAEPSHACAPAARPRLLVALVALAFLVLPALPAQATTSGASGLGVPVASLPADGAEVAFGPSRLAGASWYGPGLYGSQTACGQTLRAWTIGVAHRSLPCGTLVKFVYAGRAVIAPVIDRGPFVKGRAWDLTAAAGEALGLDGVGTVRYSVALEYARAGLAR